MDAKLTGKKAIVTGGTSGIGLAIVKSLLAEGVDVVVVSRTPEPEILDRLNGGSGRAVGINADVGQEDQVVQMIARAIDELGHVDCFVNNAAISMHRPITRIDTETYQRVLNTNLSACLWSCREVARHMVSRGSGSILVVGSTSMYTPGPTETVYRITKYGLKSIVENLAIELSVHGIRANLLVPGHYRTRLTAEIPPHIEEQLTQNIPLRRFGSTDDCGNAAVFLLSDSLSAYTTGAELVVDGGLSLRPLYFGTDQELRSLNSPAER